MHLLKWIVRVLEHYSLVRKLMQPRRYQLRT